jgi:hypothetical protein
LVTEVLGADLTSKDDGGAHLLEIRLARVTARQVTLEAAALAAGQPPVEIVPNETDRLAAIDVLD